MQGCHAASTVIIVFISVFSPFLQLFDRESCTYTYLLADTDSKEAVLIDPVIELAQRDKQVLEDLGLSLVYASKFLLALDITTIPTITHIPLFSVNTHMHADHITGTGLLKKLMPPVKSVISTESGAASDVKVTEGDKIKFGKHELEVRSTPGHTSGCVAYVSHAERCVFTGDALLIRGCGRTDFQEGDAGKLYDNVWNKILSLPENYTVYPAHDYRGHTKTSVAEEKRLNPRLTKTRAEFVELMGNLGLAYPKKIDIALPANKVCGLYDLPDNLKDLLK